MKKNILFTFTKNYFLYLVLFVFSLGTSVDSYGQYCGAATSNVAITPTATAQLSLSYNSGRRAFNFVATAGCIYNFQTCGYSTADTYLRLYSTGTGGALLAAGDDDCGTQSSITWTCPANGTYSVLMTLYSCAAFNIFSPTRLSYTRISCPSPCASNTVSFSVSSGSWPGEVSWNLVNSGGTTVATGGAPAAQSLCLPTGCYTLNMFDSFGDGWNGATYTAVLGGTTISTGTLATGTSGSVQFGVNTTCAPPPAPANDLVCNATTIACGSTTAGTTVNATSTGTYEGVSFCGTSQSSSGVWYKFIGTGQDITASLCATAWDSKIQIYSGATCTALSCIGGVDDFGPACASSSASFSWTSTLGTIYWINVSGYSTTSAFSLALTCVTPAVPPANDLVCNATAIACGSTTAGSTINGTNAGTGENGTCTTIQTMPGVWYVVPGNGQIMTASLCATTAWDSKIGVFSGPNCSALTCVGGDDDNGPACAGLMASYTWTSVAGTNYYILVHGYSTNSAFSLALSCTSPPTADLTSVTASATTICTGQNTTLTANGAVGTVYWFTGGCATSGQIATGNTLIVSPVVTTTYYARNFNGGTWSVNCASVTIVVNPNPVVNAGADQTQCPGNINLSGTVAPMTTTVFSENFGGAINWTTNDVNRWVVSNTANAGGALPEAMFQYLSGGAGTFIDASIFSQSINATGVTGLTLAFNHNVDWFVGSFALSAEVSLDNVTWTPVWTLNPTNNVPITTVTGVNLSSMDNQVFYLRYRFNGDIWNIDYWYIDNISIIGNATPASSWTSLPSGFTSTSLTPSFTVPSTTTFTLSSTVNGCTATDAVLITIQDLVNPTIASPANVTVVADAGSCTASGVALGTPTTADNCSVAGTTNDGPATYPLGNTTVTWTVTDGSGNTSTSTQIVTVTDNQNPTIASPADVSVIADAGLCTASGVALGTPTTTDNCSVAGFVNNALATYPLGNTTVTWTVTDGSGNTATSNQTVTVTDNQNPTIASPTDVSVLADAGLCTASGVALGTPTTADNCSVAGTTNDGPATYPLGITTVTWTVTDGSGNTSTSTQIVTVTDNQNPTIASPADVSVIADAGLCTASGVALGTPTTADNCSVAGTTNDGPANYPLGNTTVTWTVTDGSGNTSTSTQIVTVTDNQNPTIASPADVSVIADAGLCTASGVALGTPTTTDNCSVAGFVNNALATYPLGNTTVTWTVTDGSGNTATSTQTVTVTDNQNPTIASPSDVSVVADAGLCTASGVALGTPTTTDNCSVAGSTNNGPATYPLGNTTVTWTVTDGSGNTATSTQTVTVTDNQNPTINAPSTVTVSSDPGICSASGVNLGLPTTTDNCSVAGFVNDGTAVYPLGNTTVTWTVTDGSGNTSTATQTVTVVDTENPVLICQNVTIQLDAAGNATLTAAQVDNGSTDNCGIASLVVSQTAFDCSHVGLNPVTLTVTDNSSNISTCPSNITVEDNIAPIALCQNLTLPLDLSGTVVITPSQINNASTDNCGIASLSLSQTSFDCLSIGANNLVLTVVDVNGNSSTCSSVFTITDSSSPVFTYVPANISENAVSNLCGRVVTYALPIFDDNCDVTMSQTDLSGLTTGDIFPVGATTQTYSVTDNSGNSISASFTITIVDDQVPVITNCTANITVNSSSSNCGASVTWTPPAISDNCPGVQYTESNASGDFFPIGVTTVSYNATDASGNTSSCSFTITVVDNVSPVIPTLATLTGACTVTATAPSTTDNCGGVIIGTTSNPLTYSTQGTSTITWNFTDAAGNTSSASQTVIVLDNVAPTITAPVAVSVSANAACEATGVVLGSPVTTDNCSAVTTSNNAPATFPIGTTTVTWTATDAAGNAASATQLVTVTDNTLPTISAPASISVPANASCVAFNLNLGNPITTDNCTVASVVNNGPTVYPLGATTVTWTVTDANGNTATANQTITVLDQALPIIVAPGNLTLAASISCSVPNASVSLGNPYSSDNCTVAGISSNAPASFPIGNTTVTWTVIDGNGNTATATQLVTVVDNTNPTITAPAAVSVTTNTACTATGVALGTPITADNCAVASTTNNAPGSYPIGTTVVTWTVTDASGNTATANQVVTVTDNQNPTITAPGAIAATTNNGCVALNVNLGTPTTGDNCSVTSVTNNAPSAFNLGLTVVTWTVTDGSGHVATATQNVVITDNQNPTIVAPTALTVSLTSGCTATIASLGNAFTSDNCTVATVLNNAPATFPIGNTTVTWTVTDANGNSATATQIVTVFDNTNPTITAPAAISVNTNTACTATGVALGTPITADNCSVASTTNNAPGSYPLGTTVVTWIVTDASGNTATALQTVTVTDNQNPTIAAPATVNATTNNSCMALNVNLGTPVTTDNCSVVSVTNNAPTAFNVGTTIVTWTVTDGSGHVATATQNVVVTDIENPIIIAPANINANSTAACAATGIILGNATAIDNCTIATVVNNAPASYPVGTTTVTWTATDASGNTATATQTVTINDVVNPTITAPADISAVTNSGCTAVGLNLGTPITADNCGVLSVVNDAPASFPVGMTFITWTVTDVNGNTTTTIQKVTVVDDINPTLTVGANVTVDANNNCTAFNVDLGTPVVADNCGIASLSNDAPTVYNLGTTTVTWIAIDNNGNSITAVQTVTVVDNTAPVIIAPASLNVTTNNNCVASGLTLGNPIATDNCTVATVVNNAPTDFPVGTTVVTWTVTDAAGNTATADQSVTVTDAINPTADLQNILVTLDSQGNATVTFADVDNGSSDNCGIASTMLSQSAFDCSDIGVNTVTVTITDNNNNTTFASVTVTIQSNGIDSDNDGIDDSCDGTEDPIIPIIPEAFTPNGNNINDLFVIGNLETFTERRLDVFNRYGNSVYESKMYQNDWDGTRSDNGQALPDGTYYYVLALDNGEIKKGFVYINRVKQ